MHRLSLALYLAIWFSGASALADPAPDEYERGRRDFIAEMVITQGFEREELAALLDEARYEPAVIAAMERPFEAKPWPEYRALFVTPERVRAGAEYWRAHGPLLARARQEYGVPPEIIVAILGIETRYGRVLGSHRAIDALTTLAFSYPRRAVFFRRELEALLLLAREEPIDLRVVTGSYAGALGQPQFIPSSYRAYAVDFDQDGRRDLWHSDADVVGSVGNYLERHGWGAGDPVRVPARVPVPLPAEVPVAEGHPLRPDSVLSGLRRAGIEWEGDLPARSRASLIRLDGDYWLGLENFYAITRYNHSNLYAMAVVELGEAIKTRAEGR